MNSKQQQVFDDFCNKTSYNIAILGGAGTGKSFVFKKLVKHCVVSNVNFLVTAMTGVAAELIGGRTVHSALGIGRVDGGTTVEKIITALEKYNKVDVWKTLDVLFVDEISMMTGELFMLLNGIAQELRENDKPFGGIRMIVCGDFLQLGPVEKGLYCFL
jgi:ATP-dependent DNA helicase PIF1